MWCDWGWVGDRWAHRDRPAVVGRSETEAGRWWAIRPVGGSRMTLEQLEQGQAIRKEMDVIAWRLTQVGKQEIWFGVADEMRERHQQEIRMDLEGQLRTLQETLAAL
ncbi:MAG: hypothetical protein Q8R28_04315 [Dehalococcoidia bacterium]|nr:hypothetical protein [Dehalococcoidia bacterium]